MPSVRRTTLLKKPRGFFKPESSVRSACSVPIPPPPPPAAPPITNFSRAIAETADSERYVPPWQLLLNIDVASIVEFL